MIFAIHVQNAEEAREIRSRKDSRFDGITPEGIERWRCTEGPVKYYMLPLDKEQRAKATSGFAARAKAILQEGE